jgi:hypothetical protein
MADDECYQLTRNRLLDFLETRGGHSQAPARLTESEQHPSLPAPAAEELFIVEKYSGFNRFRARYRQWEPRLQAPPGASAASIAGLAPVRRENAV